MEDRFNKVLSNIGQRINRILEEHKKFLIIEQICAVWLPRVNGQKILKKNKKFIYLISPENIENSDFFKDLDLLFKNKNISYFQLRLKKKKFKEIISIGKKIKNICKKIRLSLL